MTNEHMKRYSKLLIIVVVVQSFSNIRIFVTSRTAARQALLSFTISQRLLKLMFIELVMLSNHLILCRPLLFLSSIFPSIRVFSLSNSVQFSQSVMSNSLQPHGLKHIRLPCPSPTPRACSNSCSSSQ